MRKLIPFLALLLSSAFLPAQTPTPLPITGNVTYITGGQIPYAGVSIQLANCPSPISIPGISVIAPTQYQLQSDGTGQINSTVWPNDKIDCNGTTGASQYSLQYIVNGTPTADPVCFQVVSTQGQWNLNSQQPITCAQTPPNPQDGQFNNMNILQGLTVNGNLSMTNGSSASMGTVNSQTENVTGTVTAGNVTTSGTVTAGSLKVKTVSKGAVLYASNSCVVNSNISTGGGTDDSVCLQGLLNSLSAAGGGTLVQDGVSLISAANVPGGPTGQTTALQIGPNTTIKCTNNGGFYLAANSNVAMLGNALTGNPGATFQYGMTVDGCIWNGNGANQSRYELGNSNNGWVFGIWFAGFDTVRLINNSIWNARTFSYVFGNGRALVMDNCSSVQTAGFGTGGNNHDGIHMWGTLDNVSIKNYGNVNGDDDALAFNTDEGVYSYNTSPLAWQVARYPNSGGAITNVTVDGVFLSGVNDALRWYGAVTTGGVTTVANINIHNVYGSVLTFGATNNIVTAAGPITVDGWHISGPGSLVVPTGGGGFAAIHMTDVVASQFAAPSSVGAWSRDIIGYGVVAEIAGSYPVTITPQTAAGTGATAVCVNQCTTLSGIVNLTTGTGPTTGQLVKVAMSGGNTTNPLNCAVGPGGGAASADSAALHPQTDLTGTTNGQFFVFAKVAPAASTSYYFTYVCTE